eukprot:gene5098-biopygen6886
MVHGAVGQTHSQHSQGCADALQGTNSQTVRLLKGCARALTAIFKRASKLQQQQPHVKQEPAHHGQQQPDLCQQIDSQVVVPTCSSTPQVLPLSGSPDTVVSAEGFRRFAWGGEQAEAPASVHHPTRKSVHDHHQARESNAAPAPLLHEGQNGFRPKRSCADHQFVLYQTLTSRRQAKQHSYVLFVDTYKAFPTVWLDGLFHKLWEKGVRGKMLRVLYNLYRGAQRVSSHAGAVTGAFTSNVGLHEGDVISPTLYLFFIDDLLREVWTKHPGVTVLGSGGDTPAQFVAAMQANDFVAVCDSIEEARAVAQTVYDYSRKWQFRLNAKKSAVMHVAPNRHQSPLIASGITWHGFEVPVVDKYCYLGL